jgi:hypothetical protein
MNQSVLFFGGVRVAHSYTEGTIKNEQSRETGHIGTQDEEKQKHNTICV